MFEFIIKNVLGLFEFIIKSSPGGLPETRDASAVTACRRFNG